MDISMFVTPGIVAISSCIEVNYFLCLLSSRLSWNQIAAGLKDKIHVWNFGKRFCPIIQVVLGNERPIENSENIARCFGRL